MHLLRRIIALLLALSLAAPVTASWGAQGGSANCDHASAQLGGNACCDTSPAGLDCGSLCTAGHGVGMVQMPMQARLSAHDVANTSFEPAVAGALLPAPDTDPPRFTLA